MSYSPTGLAAAMTYRRGQESVVVPTWRQAAGEFPYPDFRVLRDIYLSDPDFYSAVNFVANRALSHGYHIECDSKVPGHEDAEDFLTDWLDYVRWGDKRNERGYQPLLRIEARELGWGGTNVLEMIPGPDQLEAFAHVQLSSIWKFQRDSTGALRGIWQYMSINPAMLTPEKYVVSSWNEVDHNPFGYGLLHPVALSKPNVITGGVIPPLAAIKWQLEDDARRRMHRYAQPRTIFSTKALSRDEIKPFAEQLKNPEADFSGITNAEVGVVSDAPAGRGNFGPDLDFVEGRIKAATGNILTEMLTGKGFSYACFSEDTLILTEAEGWKNYWEVHDGERIAAYDPERDTIEFVVPDAKFVYDYDGEMLHFRSTYADALVTPNHRMYYRTRYWKIAEAQKLEGMRNLHFKVNASRWEAGLKSKVGSFTLQGVSGNGLRMSQALDLIVEAESWLKFAGYYISEGSLTEQLGMVSLCQKKLATVERIRQTLAGLGVPWKEYPSGVHRDAIQFHVKGGKRLAEAVREFGVGAQNKRIPFHYKNLARPQLITLLEALLEGDGTKDPRKGRTSRSYFTTSSQLAHDVLEIVMRIGYSAFITWHDDPRTDYKRHRVYRVSIRESGAENHTVELRDPLTRERYHGKVFCFTVPSGLLLTMRDGKPSIQGNSAVKAGSLADEIVWDMQSVIKLNTENWILQPVLSQNGYDARLLKPKFVYNIPDNPQEWTIADLITAFLNQAISKADFVRNAKTFGKWDLDDPVETGPSPSAPMGTQQPIPNPGNLPTVPGQTMDPVAMQNLMRVQGEVRALERKINGAIEAIGAGGSGAASAVSRSRAKSVKKSRL